MLTIGQMSRACSVSIKTLHHYDRIGLLKPSQIDPDSGYRYYEDSQIPRMLLISRLKRYGFSLSEIGELLNSPDSAARELGRQKFRLEREAERLSILIREMQYHLRELERTGDLMSYQEKYEITLKQSEELFLLTRRQKMSVEEFGTYYGQIYEKIARERLTPSGLTMTIYHDMEFDPSYSDVELGVEILEKEKAELVLPARTCVSTVHVGPYSGLPDAYGAAFSWLNLHGYVLDGAPFEIYRKTQFDGIPAEEWVTEIYFPVKEK